MAILLEDLFYGSYLRFWNKKQKEIINETSYSTCAKMCKKLKFNVCEQGTLMFGDSWYVEEELLTDNEANASKITANKKSKLKLKSKQKPNQNVKKKSETTTYLIIKSNTDCKIKTTK